MQIEAKKGRTYVYVDEVGGMECSNCINVCDTQWVYYSEQLDNLFKYDNQFWHYN
jgi:NAD-dependent dihydropyrimidine dehydrogenase PreA subunit